MTLREALQGTGAVRGTRRLSKPSSAHYQRFYISKPQVEATPAVLIRLWLNGDEGFSLSQYREWFKQAEDYLGSINYSKKEHKSLLARGFELYLRRN